MTFLTASKGSTTDYQVGNRPRKVAWGHTAGQWLAEQSPTATEMLAFRQAEDAGQQDSSLCDTQWFPWEMDHIHCMHSGDTAVSPRGLEARLFFSTLPLSEASSFKAGWMTWMETFREGHVRAPRLLSRGEAA